MIRLFKNFRKDESGAVTVDWVVLTAAVVALAGAAYVAIEGGTSTLSTAIQNELNDISPDSDGAGGGGSSGGSGSGG
ncbi:MAG: hypothetical protein ABJH07_06365 [Sedimentitalea sp.]|uniref:hypothetical protein n=1 Tax=Sedimentitalea sp. TaxID=2048915 RepID=UPI003265292D